MQAVAPQAMTQNMHASASLYVGDLSPDVPESKLYELFNNIGQVQSVRVPRDVNTRRSLGYAYVNYHRVADAERALEIMNFKKIGDRNCRIMWSQRDPNLRKSGKGNIFIKNLAKEIDHEQLRDTFASFGSILSCKVALSYKGESLGYGFVHFANEADGTRAVEAVNGQQLMDRVVTVAPFVSRQQRGAIGKFTNVYAKNLPRDMSQEAFEKLFAGFGEITSSKLVVAKGGLGVADENKTNFGFINFRTTEEARQAIDTMNGSILNDKKLFVARAQKKEERDKELKQRFDQIKQENQLKYVGVNLYIKNLSDTINDEKLRNLFLEFGEITSAKVMLDATTNKSKGFGFVCFSSSEEAVRAVAMQGTMIEGKPLYVAMAQRKVERQMHIEQNMARRNLAKSQQGAIYGPSAGYGGVPMRAPPMYANQMSQWAAHGPMMAPSGFPAGRYQLVPQANQPGRGLHGGQRRGGGGRGGGGQRQGPGAMNMRGQGGQMKYDPRQRGPPQVPQQISQPETQHPPVQPEELSVADFVKAAASLPDVKRKHVFGERLFPMVAAAQPDLAPKITGMLLEMEDTEIVELLESSQALERKIAEAMSVLEESVDGSA